MELGDAAICIEKSNDYKAPILYQKWSINSIIEYTGWCIKSCVRIEEGVSPGLQTYRKEIPHGTSSKEFATGV